MAVIELGLVNPDGDEPYAEPGRRPLRRPELRRVLVALVAVLCVLTVTGSARPDPRGLTQLWSAPLRQDADTFRLAGDAVYVINQEPSPRLTVYDARTGTVRWSTADIEDTTWLAGIAAGVVLLPAGSTTVSQQEPDGSGSSREFSRDTVALDAATGRKLWRRLGAMTAPLGDRVLLSEWDEAGERARLLRVIRLRDGAPVWSRANGELDFWTTDTTSGAAAERLVTVTAQGRVEVVAITDGSVVATGRIPWTDRSQNDDYTTLTVQGRRLYLDQTRQGDSTVTAYDTETLRLLWRVPQASPGGSYGCGPVVCLTDVDGITGHDRETGRVLWRLPGTSNIYPLLDGRLVIDEEPGGRRSVIHGLTGRRLADLGAAMPVWDGVGRGTPYLLAPTVQPPDRTSVSSFDPAGMAVLLRGTIMPVIEGGCQQEGSLLACQTPDNRLVVTDVG